MAHPNAGGPLTYFARSNSVWCHGRPCWPPEGLGATIVAKLLWINKFSHPVGKLLATPMVSRSLFRSATQRPCSLDSNINPGFHIIVRSSRMPAIDQRRLQNWYGNTNRCRPADCLALLWKMLQIPHRVLFWGDRDITPVHLRRVRNDRDSTHSHPSKLLLPNPWILQVMSIP